ncbi:MAG: hypothetical protein LC105_10760 [Chitinophagales bacterium]|nr:hypothetical protein [Chitinophagales bacterium]MCZ2394330.1 hypothetical protein [Chitinophagales bacterium]
MALVSFSKNSGNEKKAFLYATIIFIAFLLLLFLWNIKYENNVEPGGGGIELDFGNSDYGLGEDNTSLGTPSAANPIETPLPEVSPTPQNVTTPEVKATTSHPPKVNTPPNNTMTSTNADAIAIEKQKKEAEKAAKAEQDRIQKEAKIKAEQEAKIKAEQDRIRKEQEEFAQKMKGGMSGINNGNGTGGSGSGQGQGNSKPGGNQGSPDGSMNGGNGTGGSGGGTGGGHGTGDGLGSGSGKGSSVSHNLTGRNILSKPEVVNNRNALGKVVITVKVNKNGIVTDATYSSQGSSTNDAYLIDLSIKSARKIKFSATSSGADEQFGRITFNYTN